MTDDTRDYGLDLGLRDAAPDERQRIRNLIDQFSAGYHTADEMPDLILGTFAAARREPPAGLDADRLAEALRYVERTMQYAMGVKAPDDGPPDEWYDGYARAVAKRYWRILQNGAGS